MNRTLSTITVLVTLMLASGCSEQKANQEKQSNYMLPEELILKQEPKDVVSVKTALAQAAKGKMITVSGVITGKNCFDKDLAIFTLTQKSTSKANCAKSACGGCPSMTPRLLVQYKDPKGQVVKSSFQGFKGLKTGSNVAVTGSVDDVSTKKSLVINLKGLYIMSK